MEDHYESMHIDAVEISAGTEKPLTVSLKPKSPGSQETKTTGRPNRFNI